MRYQKSPTGAEDALLSGALILTVTLLVHSTVIANMMGILTELYEETIQPDRFGALPLHYAAKAGIFEIVEMLYQR